MYQGQFRCAPSIADFLNRYGSEIQSEVAEAMAVLHLLKSHRANPRGEVSSNQTAADAVVYSDASADSKKNNVSTLALMRHLRVCYRTVRRLKHLLIQVMAMREAKHLLSGREEIDSPRWWREWQGTPGLGIE